MKKFHGLSIYVADFRLVCFAAAKCVDKKKVQDYSMANEAPVILAIL